MGPRVPFAPALLVSFLIFLLDFDIFVFFCLFNSIKLKKNQ